MMVENLELPNSNPNELSEEEVSLAAELLSRLAPGQQPLPIFLQIARLRPLPGVEFIVFGPDNQRREVLLTRRNTDDPHWPDHWHIPGVIVEATDKSMDYALNRLIHTEL